MSVDLLYLMGGLGIGGTERHLSLVLPELVRRGWRIEVALLTGDGPFGEPLRTCGIPVTPLECGQIVPLPKLRGLSILRGQARALARRLRADPPGLLHCFLPHCCIVGGWAARQAGFAPVAMSRRSQSDRPSLFLGDKWLERRALRRADRVFGHSRQVIAELTNEGIAPSRLGLIHNGIPLPPPPGEAERLAARRALGWSEDEVVVTSVANLIPYKGHADLLRGLARTVTGGRTRCRLALVGGGAAESVAALKQLAADLSIAEQISFLGQRDDVAPVLAASDIGVLMSHHEGFSNALLEYMAAALPVIATATGGNLDAIEEGVTGFLVPVGGEAALSATLDRMFDDAALRRRLGAAGRDRVESCFSLASCVDAYDAAYRAMLTTSQA